MDNGGNVNDKINGAVLVVGSNHTEGRFGYTTIVKAAVRFVRGAGREVFTISLVGNTRSYG